MTVNEIVSSAEWITAETNIIIKYRDYLGIEHIMAEGSHKDHEVRYWGSVIPVSKFEMALDVGEAVFYIGYLSLRRNKKSL